MPSNWYTVSIEMYGFSGWYVPVNYKKTNTVIHKMNVQEDKETIFEFREAKSNTYGLLPDFQFFHVSYTEWYFVLLIFSDS